VGKTTTAINLGAYLARLGQRVLIVDLDSQANATSCLGVNKHNVQSGTYEALLGISPAANSLLTNPDLKLTLLPSSPALAGAEVELATETEGRGAHLRQALAPLAEAYDYILIDCPPSLGILTLNGLLAAQDGVIIPVQCEYLALEGLGQLMSTIQRVRGIFPTLKVRGVILTMYDARAHLSTDVVTEVRKHFPNQVFSAIVPRSVRLAEAPSYGLPIAAYAPASTGAQAYEALARELMQGDGVLPTQA
jgi:chromosome partitioning protein